MAFAAVAMAAASAAAGIAGSIIEGQAQGAAHDANSRIAEQNRDIAHAQGYAREDQVRRRAAMILGAQYASTAQSGVDPNSGSAALALKQSATNAELDALTTRYEGLIQGFGYQRESVMERDAAKRSRKMGHVNALLSSVGGAKVIGAAAKSGSYGGTSWGGSSSTFGPGSGFENWDP